MYRSHIGPDYYSFIWGGVHSIGLNTVSFDDSGYYGNIDSAQLAWLKRDLAHIPVAMPVVAFNHIPPILRFTTWTGLMESNCERQQSPV
ncbi:MAG: hypothetical protein ABJB66_12450 [Gemmatimonadaceae bacterium]